MPVGVSAPCLCYALPPLMCCSCVAGAQLCILYRQARADVRLSEDPRTNLHAVLEGLFRSDQP